MLVIVMVKYFMLNYKILLPHLSPCISPHHDERVDPTFPTMMR